MLGSQLAVLKKSFSIELFGNKGGGYFWQARFLPRWLPLLLGVVMGISSAVLIVNDSTHLAIVLCLIIPVGILFIRYPFVSVLIWLLLMPFFAKEGSAAGRVVFWMIHRSLIPGTIILVFLLHWIGVKRKKRLVDLNIPDLALFALMGLILVSIELFSRDPRAYYKFYDRWLVPICMYWLIKVTVPGRKDLKRLLWVAFFTVIFQCVISLLSVFAPGLVPLDWHSNYQGGIRTEGTLGNVAVYTSTIIFLSTLLLQYGLNSQSRWTRTAVLLTFALVGFCVFFSFSRGSWLGGLLVLTGLLIIYPKEIGRVAIILVVLVVILSGSILSSYVAWGHERLFGQHSQQTADDRMIANYASWRMIEAKPWLGWGFESRGYYSLDFTRTRVGNVAASYKVSSHNTYLTSAVELGLVGLFLSLFPAAWWLILTFKKWRQLPKSGFWSRRLLVVFWLAMLHFFVVTNFMEMSIHPFGLTLWWLELGLIANFLSPYLKSDSLATRATWASTHRAPRFDLDGLQS